MKTSILSIFLLIAGATVQAQNKYFTIFTDSAELKNQNDQLILDIETQVKKVSASFSFKGLTTEVPKTFMPGQFRENTNKIYHTTWQTGGPPMEGFLKDMAGSREEGEKMAGAVFLWFFLST